MNANDRLYINQLTSSYSPLSPPQLPLGMGDYLSLLWWMDYTADTEAYSLYYRRCAAALAKGLSLQEQPVGILLSRVAAGDAYNVLSHPPYWGGTNKHDAGQRRTALQHLLRLRSQIMSISAQQQELASMADRWPGNAILDTEIRNRVSTVLFNVLPGQYAEFASMLLLIDIVLQEMITGQRRMPSIPLYELVTKFNYPKPEDPSLQHLFSPR